MRTCKECACHHICNITHTDNDTACIDYKAEAITELKKIKSEIFNSGVDLKDGTENGRLIFNEAIGFCYRIVCRHIKELEDENK